jgi:hypothetical protein
MMNSLKKLYRDFFGLTEAAGRSKQMIQSKQKKWQKKE